MKNHSGLHVNVDKPTARADLFLGLLLPKAVDELSSQPPTFLIYPRLPGENLNNNVASGRNLRNIFYQILIIEIE